MKGFATVFMAVIATIVLCGVAVAVPMGDAHGARQLFNPDTSVAIGGVFFAVGLFWRRKFLKK